MSALILLVVVLSTLAFGAVYPWAYLPLFGCAALLGVAGLVIHPRTLADRRAIWGAALLLVIAVTLQLVDLPREMVQSLSPHAATLLSRYSLSSTGAAPSHALSIDPSATRLALFGLTALALYAVGVSGALSAQGLRALPRNLMFFAVPLAVFGIASRQQSNGLIYWFWHPEQGGAENSFGPFVNRNHFAGWMLMASCLAMGFQLGQLERLRKGANRDWHSLLVWLSSTEAGGIALTTIGLLVMVVSLVWTMSRSGISAFVVAVGCFVLLIFSRKSATAGRRVTALALVTLMLFAGIGWRGSNVVGRWFGDTRDVYSRFAAWQDGWSVVTDFPLVGTGMNTYPVAMLFYQKHNLDVFMSEAHNDYLQLLAEGGLLVVIPAAAVAMALILAILRNLAAVRHESLGYWIRAGAAVGLVSMAVQEVAEFSLQMPANGFLFCTLAAIALTPGFKRSHAIPGSTS